MNVNPMQLIQMIKGGKNPQQLLMNVLQQQGQNNNPIINNAINMAQNGNVSGLEVLARNLAAQRGLDFDKELANLKNQFM